MDFATEPIEIVMGHQAAQEQGTLWQSAKSRGWGGEVGNAPSSPLPLGFPSTSQFMGLNCTGEKGTFPSPLREPRKGVLGRKTMLNL